MLQPVSETRTRPEFFPVTPSSDQSPSKGQVKSLESTNGKQVQEVQNPKSFVYEQQGKDTLKIRRIWIPFLDKLPIGIYDLANITHLIVNLLWSLYKIVNVYVYALLTNM